MGKINWGRVFVCGLVTGFVLFAVGGVIFTVRLAYFDAEMSELGPGAPFSIFLVLVLNLVVGIVTIWLYAAIRPRYGPGPKTAAVAGFAVWLIFSLAVLILASVGMLPVRVPLLASSLAGSVVGTVAGARYYKE